MIDSGGKKVVFRISGSGFSLAIEALVEIKGIADVRIDRASADPMRGLLGLLSFRGETIQLLDVRQMFGLPPAADSIIVLVFGSDAVWAFPIETVVRVALSAEFQRCKAPELLQKSERRLFDSLDIWHGEPLVCFEPAMIEQLMVQG